MTIQLPFIRTLAPVVIMALLGLTLAQQNAQAMLVAMAYLGEGKSLDKALRILDAALPHADRLAPYLLDTRGQIEIKQGRFKEAERDFAEAEHQGPAQDPDFQKQLKESRGALAKSRTDTGDKP